MPLYLVEHHHTPERCPTKNPDLVRRLVSHVSPANAERYGVKLLADFVYEAEHTVVLVLEADSPDKAASFALPFLGVGSVTIKAGATCEQVGQECLGG